MRSDFRRFRLFWLLARLFMAIAILSCVVCWIWCSFIEQNMVVFAIGTTVLLVFGVLAAIFEYAAYDQLLCPRCGQRVAKPIRNTFDSETRERYRAICKGLPVKCEHCGSEVITR